MPTDTHLSKLLTPRALSLSIYNLERESERPISHKRNGGFQHLGEMDINEDTHVNAAFMVDKNMKLRHGQYMGNAKKQLFLGKEAFPSITCFICNCADRDTWLHVFLK